MSTLCMLANFSLFLFSVDFLKKQCFLKFISELPFVPNHVDPHQVMLGKTWVQTVTDNCDLSSSALKS